VFDLPVLTGVLDGREFSPGKPIRNKDVLEALRVLSLARQVDDDVFRNISEICVASGKDFVFYTAEFGVPVILGREEIGIQLVKFESFWKSVVARQGADRLQYIDLRFEDQVVVRWNHNDGDVHS
jgi:cell division septal protein FtsQ